MAKNIRAKFFEEQRETTTVALVEISIIGDPSTVVLKSNFLMNGKHLQVAKMMLLQMERL